jgi:hypothetical protein
MVCAIPHHESSINEKRILHCWWQRRRPPRSPSTKAFFQTLEREQKASERDVLEALGEYRCDAGMSVEYVPAVVDIKTLKGRFIAHKFSIAHKYCTQVHWVGGG